MLDGRWLYAAAVPVALTLIARRADPGRTVVALVALAHVVILANVALFPIPIDSVVAAGGRSAILNALGILIGWLVLRLGLAAASANRR